MKRIAFVLTLAGFLTFDPFPLWNQTVILRAQSNERYHLQVASLPDKVSAQKEINRLKSYKIKGQIISWEDRSNKSWFIIYIGSYPTKEEAVRQGNQLIQKGIIRTFRISPLKSKEEPPDNVEKPSPPVPPPPQKESLPQPGHGPVYVGPIFSEETKEETPTIEKESPPIPSSFYSLQVASLASQEAAQKELERLKPFQIQAKYLIREAPAKKKWFVVYTDRFKSKEEAILKGQQLVQKKIIKSFKVIVLKGNEGISTPKAQESPPAPKVKESPSAPTALAKKEPPRAQEKNPVYFGPISIREEDSSIRINIVIESRIFPEISSDMIAEGSRLLVTFKNIDRYIVPIEFEKVQSKTLLSLNLAKNGADCTFIIVLNSSYNYEVAQNYYEKEKIYSLVIGKEPSTNPPPLKKE